MLNILGYFSSLDFYLIILFLIILGAITQSAIGIGFGIPAGILVLLEPSMVPSCIILMGSFLALSNAMLSYKDIIKVGIDPILDKFKDKYQKINHKVSDFFSYKNFKKLNLKKKADVITAFAVFYDVENPNKFLSDIKKCLDNKGIFIIEQSTLLI